MGAMKSYDSDQIAMSFAGIPITGFADDEFVRWTRESNGFDDVVGTDGEVTRSKNNDRRGTVTFVLMSSSSTNAQLSALHNLDCNQPGGVGVGALRIEDLQGTTLISGAQAWIQKFPDGARGKTAGSVEWVIRVAQLDEIVGGN